MIIVTGGAGFIGSNIVKGLNKLNKSNILVVDDLSDGTKFKNIVDCKIIDYMDKDDFLEKIKHSEGFAENITAILHEGACSVTTEWDGYYMMQNNYEYSKILLHYCLSKHIPFIYASSAAIYGLNKTCIEDSQYERPINVYGYSKFLFDQYVRKFLVDPGTQIVGLRYFNVYGNNEQHKADMASVAWHFNRQLQETGKVKLFGEYDGYAAGEQMRDFIFVDDVVDVNLWFLNHPKKSGIFNVGTGRGETFNALAKEVIRYHGTGEIEYVPFPKHLVGAYQSYTVADLTKLRAAGYSTEMKTVSEGVKAYLERLNK